MTEGIVEKHVRGLYSTDDTTAPLKQIVNEVEQSLIYNGNFDITNDFLWLVFLKPQITQQIHLASARTIDRFQEAVRSQNPGLVKELVFFIAYKRSEGFLATEAPEKPAAYDMPVPKIKTVEDPQRQTMVMVHTHPPIDSVLAPSTIVRRTFQKDKTKYAGDLYAFWGMRKLSRESVGIKGREVPEFIERPLSLILQDHPESETTKLFFIRESEARTTLSEQEYIDQLKRNKKRIIRAKNEQTVQRVLADLGFNSSYLSLPITHFYDYPLLTPDQIDQIAGDLDLK